LTRIKQKLFFGAVIRGSIVRIYSIIVIYRRQDNNIVTDRSESECLLGLLDGLPLAIAQAAAFLQESGYDFKTYIECYEDQWRELMNSRDWEGAPLQDYPDRSVWTTWAISYNAIRERHVPAANLLLLWAFLDRKDLWYNLFAAACSASKATETSLSEWIGDLAINKVEFAKAIQLLRNYSLIEDIEGRGSYATHPVVHRWAYYFQGKDSRVQLGQLAVMVVGWAVPSSSSRDYSILQRRLLPHAQACSRWVLTDEMRLSSRSHERVSTDIHVSDELVVMLDAIHQLGNLYMNQGNLAEAEQMYEWVLQGYEKALGAEHTSTLVIVNNLGNLYADQGKLAEAEQMYEQALQGYERALGTDNATTYIPALHTIWGLGSLFERQADFLKAKIMYSKALIGYEKVRGPDDSRTRDLRDKLRALVAVTETEALKDVEVNNSRGETSRLGAARAPSDSKRHKYSKSLV
jgi:tetratricopeptide (TPR) repeat protein